MTIASVPEQAVVDNLDADLGGERYLMMSNVESCEMVRWRSWTLTLLVETLPTQSTSERFADRLSRLQPSSVRGEKSETNTAKMSLDPIGCSCFASPTLAELLNPKLAGKQF